MAAIEAEHLLRGRPLAVPRSMPAARALAKTMDFMVVMKRMLWNAGGENAT